MTKDNIAIAALLQTREACWEANAQPDASQVCDFFYYLIFAFDTYDFLLLLSSDMFKILQVET